MNPFGSVPKRQNSAQADTGTSSNPFANIPLARPNPGDFDTGQSMSADEPGAFGRIGRGLNQAFTNQNRAQARAMNEFALRDIAAEDGSLPGSVAAQAGFNRPMFNPEGRPTPTALGEAASITAGQLPQVPQATLNATLRAARGGNFSEQEGVLDRLIDRTAIPRNPDADPNYDAFEGLADSLGFSLSTQIPSSLATVGATAASGNPAVGIGAGMAVSGGLAYRGSRDQFMSTVREHLENESGRKFTHQEWAQVAPEYADFATRYGLWEAGPQAVSNAVFHQTFARPLAGARLGDRLQDTLLRGARLQGVEQGTEVAIGAGQNRTSVDAGIEDRVKPLDEIFRDQAINVALSTGIMQAPPTAARIAHDSTQWGKKRNLGNAMMDAAEGAVPSEQSILDTVAPVVRQAADTRTPMAMPEEVDVDFNQSTPQNTRFRVQAISDIRAMEGLASRGELTPGILANTELGAYIPRSELFQYNKDIANGDFSFLQKLRERVGNDETQTEPTQQQPQQTERPANPFMDLIQQYSTEQPAVGDMPQQTETGQPGFAVAPNLEQNQTQTEAQPVVAQETPVREPQTEPTQQVQQPKPFAGKPELQSRWDALDKPDNVQDFLRQVYDSPDSDNIFLLPEIMPDVVPYYERRNNIRKPVYLMLEGRDPAALQAAQQAYDAFRGVGQPVVPQQTQQPVAPQQTQQPVTQQPNQELDLDTQAYAAATKYIARVGRDGDRVIVDESDAREILRDLIGNPDQIPNPDYFDNLARMMSQATRQNGAFLDTIPLPPSAQQQQTQQPSTPTVTESNTSDTTSRFEDLYKQSRQGRALDRIDFDRNVRAVADLVEKAGGNHRMVRKHLTDDNARPDAIKATLDEIRNTLGDNEAFSDLLDRMGAPVPVRQKQQRQASKPDDPDTNADILNDVESDSSTDDTAETLQDTNQEVTDFNKVSKTMRQSRFETLWHEIGLDPAEARSLPPQEQYKKVVQALRDKYGFKEITRDKGMPIRMALDSMLDAYRNLHFMAHSLGLPLNAMSLDGKLTLSLEADGQPYLGAFTPSEQKLSMPGRSNSFAHEWGHAFDYQLLSRLTDEKFSGLSGLIRKKGIADYVPENSEQAMVALMNTLFFDQAAQAAEITKLEVAIENAKTIPAKDKLQKKLDAILDGNSQTRSTKSEYYKTSGEMGANQSQKGYWRKPTEMLARALEAYVASKVALQEGGSNEFITKGNEAYLSKGEERLAKSFPKDHERDAIFLAFDNLFDAVRSEGVLGQDRASSPNATLGVVDLLRYSQAASGAPQTTDGVLKRFWQREYKDVVDTMRREREKVKDRPVDPKKLGEHVNDKSSMYLYGGKGEFKMFEARYKGNSDAVKAILKLRDKLFRDPGAGRKTNDYESYVKLRLNQFGMHYDNINKKHGLDKWSKADLMNLREALIGTRGITDPKIKAAASDLRRLMDSIWYYARESGIKIGYVENSGYLPRAIDIARLMSDSKGFVRQATKVYDVVFRDETGINLNSSDPFGGDINFDALFNDYLKHKAPARGDGSTPESKALWRAYEAWSNADPDARDAEAQALTDLINQNQDLIQDTRDSSSRASAIAWEKKISLGDIFGFSTRGPNADFRKERTLPKEADTLMRDFYQTDVQESILGYLTNVVRRAEFAKRFGDDGSGLTKTSDELQEAGIHPTDIERMMKFTHMLTGQQQSMLPTDFHKVASGIHFLGTITLLTNAAWSSIAEPLTIQFTTGRMRDSVKMIVGVVGWATRLKGKKRREALREIMTATGVVPSSAVRSIMSSRLGGSYASDAQFAKGLDWFFKSTFLTPMTDVQRTLAGEIGLNYFGRMLNDATSPKSEYRKFALAELAEYGIAEADVARFSKWFDENVRNSPDGIPSLESIFGSPEGDMMAYALKTFADYTIQDPEASDRPYMASTPYGRLAFGIQSFAYGYWNNVMRRSYERLKRHPGMRSKLAFNTLLATSSMIMAQAFVRILRDAIYNPTKYEDEDEATKRWLQFLTGLEMANVAPPPVQMLVSSASGLRYERDLVGIMAGPHIGSYMQHAQRASQVFVRNSENTNTAEFRSIQGAHALFVSPALGYGLTRIPGGSVAGHTAAGVVSYGQSRAASEMVAEALVGPRGTRKDDGTRRRESRERPKRPERPER